jgi:signal transduction histidine kinase/DNA-binding NarL/FixJ family response regulator
VSATVATTRPGAALDPLALLRALDEGVAAKTGAAFFPHLVHALAEALGASGAFASQIDLETYRAHVLAMWNRGSFGEPFSYLLAGTPCECVLDNEIVAFPRGIQDLFPEDRQGLAGLGAESFLAIPLCDEAGAVRGHIAVLDGRERDWSEADFGILRIFSARAGAELERRNYERRLEVLNAALETANTQLRAELVQRLKTAEQLSEAQRVAEHARQAAESASQAKTNFLAHMSHELRTPLNGILGYAQLLRRDAALGPDQRESVSVIERSGEHLLTLINDLLDLAKIEAGRLELHMSLFSPAQLLKHVAEIATVRARQAGVAFTLELSPGLPLHVRGDERALRQVLLNLVGNAIKFTPQGGVALRVAACEVGDAQRCTVRFLVEDSGPGIAPEDVERIFQPFERAGSASRFEGTGLGLAITKRLVAAMQGRLNVASRLGEGSTFSVELDFLTVAEGGSEVVGSRQIVGYEGARLRVLIVDNDAISGQVLARLLESVGFRTIMTSSGAAALTIAERERPDLIVTDLAMPGMSGLEMTESLRRNERLERVPILAVSASASAFTREEALGAGCDVFLAKPVHADELFTSIGALLRLRFEYSESVVQAPPTRDVGPVHVDARHVSELLDLAMQGDVKELIAKAEQAARADPGGVTVYAEVGRLARAFDMRGVRRLLQGLREEGR